MRRPQPAGALEGLLSTGSCDGGRQRRGRRSSSPTRSTGLRCTTTCRPSDSSSTGAAEVLDAGAALAHRVAATDHVDDDLAVARARRS